MEPTIEDAIILATKLHKGQKDKGGEPYILHPLRVMLKMKTMEEKIVGVLHDTLEDCNISHEFLKELGYAETIITALLILTKRPEEENDYDAFITRVKESKSPLAIKAKHADLLDNMDISRITCPVEIDFQRVEKYKKALNFLSMIQQ
jgi:(p)ppGpp synthase/HD superfamily hydrolase